MTSPRKPSRRGKGAFSPVQAGSKFGTRYAALGFSDRARLDEGLAALVERAAG